MKLKYPRRREPSRCVCPGRGRPASWIRRPEGAEFGSRLAESPVPTARKSHQPYHLCGPRDADVREDWHCGNAKRLKCVQLAGAIIKGGHAESGSKLHTLL